MRGLENGTKYTFQVRALNGNREGAPSGEASATPQVSSGGGSEPQPESCDELNICNLQGASHSYGQVTVSWDTTPNATYYEYEYMDQDNPTTCQELVDQGYLWYRVNGTGVTLDVGQAVTVCVRAVKDEREGYHVETGPPASVNVSPIGG